MKKYIEKITKTGHFELASEKHSDKYIVKDEIFFNTEIINKILFELKTKVFDFLPIDLITGPATAGAILASNVALSLNIPFVYPDKKEGNMVFRKCFHKPIKGSKILIIEDIITVGSSVSKLINTIEELGGFISGILCICNRGNWNPRNYIIRSIIDLNFESWDAADCPLCKYSKVEDPKDML
jgi:orotate phosphoribosyltransferase